MIVNLDKSDVEKEVIESDKPVVIEFHSLWNSACRAFSTMFEELAREYEGKVKFAQSNIDGNPDLAEELNISNIPTVVLFCDGIEIKRMLNPSRAWLKQELDSLLRKIKRF